MGISELDVSVFDDFLSPALQLEVLEALRTPGWSLGRCPVIEGEERQPARIWHLGGLQKNPLFSERIFKIICEKTQSACRIRRIYANGQVACQKGKLHHDDGDLTVLYYPLQEWRQEWGGNLLFYNGREVAACVSYVPNRALSFPARRRHVAEAPSRDYEGLRVSVAWKLVMP